jgi:2-succinyl-5-enolpyruvyl-6-hydroxy-3-cyclohexene-1-carboxylate synthase
MDLTTTPHSTSVSQAAAAFGVPAVRVATELDLQSALRHAYSTPGCTVVEAVASPHGAAQQHRRIWAAANAAIVHLRAQVA